MKLYGIPNCNTVKKARTWLTDHSIEVIFHDFKKNGVTKPMLENWCKQVGWETLVNRKGTTWRQLPDEIKNNINNESDAIVLMLEKPSVIKRPILEAKQKILVGFDEATYATVCEK